MFSLDRAICTECFFFRWRFGLFVNRSIRVIDGETCFECCVYFYPGSDHKDCSVKVCLTLICLLDWMRGK